MTMEIYFLIFIRLQKALLHFTLKSKILHIYLSITWQDHNFRNSTNSQQSKGAVVGLGTMPSNRTVRIHIIVAFWVIAVCSESSLLQCLVICSWYSEVYKELLCDLVMPWNGLL